MKDEPLYTQITTPTHSKGLFTLSYVAPKASRHINQLEPDFQTTDRTSQYIPDQKKIETDESPYPKRDKKINRE